MRIFRIQLAIIEGAKPTKKSKFAGQQIAFGVRESEAGTALEEVCRKRSVSQATLCRRKNVNSAFMPSEAGRLKQLREEMHDLADWLPFWACKGRFRES